MDRPSATSTVEFEAPKNGNTCNDNRNENENSKDPFPGRPHLLKTEDDDFTEDLRSEIQQRIKELEREISDPSHNDAEKTFDEATPNIEARLLDERWRPPPLLDLPYAEQFHSTWTWMGDVDRFELVKTLRRCVNSRGQPLSDPELEYSVLMHEDVEFLMQHGMFAEAIRSLQQLIGMFPNDVLANFLLALSLLAARGVGALDQASRLLRFAYTLEPENSHLRSNIDFILLLSSKSPIPEEHWKENYPKSGGMWVALQTLITQFCNP